MAPHSTAELKVSDYVISEPDRLGGDPCFVGSRVPVRTLFHYVRKGLPLEQFLDDFEGVTREQVDAVLALAEAGLLRQVKPT